MARGLRNRPCPRPRLPQTSSGNSAELPGTHPGAPSRANDEARQAASQKASPIGGRPGAVLGRLVKAFHQLLQWKSRRHGGTVPPLLEYYPHCTWRDLRGRDLRAGSVRRRLDRYWVMLTTLDLRATDDPRDIVHRTVQALVEGHVVALPTETVYGLAADALNERAVEQFCEIKGRDVRHPLAISVPSREAAEDFVCEMSPLARRLCNRCWPGPLTLVASCQSPHSGGQPATRGSSGTDHRRVWLRWIPSGRSPNSWPGFIVICLDPGSDQRQSQRPSRRRRQRRGSPSSWGIRSHCCSTTVRPVMVELRQSPAFWVIAWKSCAKE